MHQLALLALATSLQPHQQPPPSSKWLHPTLQLPQKLPLASPWQPLTLLPLLQRPLQRLTLPADAQPSSRSGQRYPLPPRNPPSQHQSTSEPLSVHTSPLSHSEMARVRPLTIPYQLALGPKLNTLSFASLHLVDLHNQTGWYLTTLKDLCRALPKTTAEGTRLALQGSIARLGQRRLRRSMRAAIWFLLPSDGEFILDPVSLQYYLARRGRRVILRGGDVKGRPLEDKLNWEQDPCEYKEKEKSPLSTTKNRNTGEPPLSPEEERRKDLSCRSKAKSPIQSANQTSQLGANWI